MSGKTTLVNMVHCATCGTDWVCCAKESCSLHGNVVLIPAPPPRLPSKVPAHIGQSLIVLALVGLIGLTYFTLYAGERTSMHLTDGITVLLISLVIIPPIMWIVKQLQRFTKK